MSDRETLRVLLDAYHLLDDKKRWTQGTLARDQHGMGTDPRGPAAVSWCAVGALRKVTPPLGSCAAANALNHASLNADSESEDIEIVNDTMGGCRLIRAAYRRAIRRLERELGQT